MAAINGVVIPGTLVPTDTTDTYAVTDPQYGIDGCRSVPDKTARNAIPLGRRRQGMLAVIQQDFGSGPNTVWQLKAPPWNNNDADWVQLIIGTTTSTVGGDLSGTLPNPSVISTNGVPFGTIATQNANSVAITGGTITGLSTPVSASDAVNKSYVDATTAGLSARASCRLASTANISSTYSNGSSGVGATLTNAGSLAAFSLDGVSASLNDRILIKDQTTTFQNGIYTLTTIGSGSVAWVLTRAVDYNTPSLVVAGTYTVISGGTVNTGTLWVETGLGPFTIGTTSIIFTRLVVPPLTITFTGDISGTGFGTIATTTVGLNGNPLGSTTPVGGNLLIASGTQWVSVHPSGDATISAAGLIMVTKTNGVSFAASATTDTTNATNITSGIVSAARLGAGIANTTTFLRGDGVWAIPSSAASSISIGSAITGGTPDSVLYVDSNAFLAQDNTNLNYNPSTQVFTATHLAGAGGGITNLNASNLASGTIPTARLGSGTASSTTFLAGNNTWQPITVSASTVTYSNTVSGLPSADVQSAIDILSSLVANRNISNGTALISGGGVAWVSGYTFEVSAATYYIANVFHSSLEQAVTLTTPDSTHDRIDAVVLDTTGTVSSITGVPAPVPVPPVIDPRTYIELAYITVTAGSTQPTFVTKVLVYNENAGTPVEWATTSSGSGWALASTNNPYTGTKDIEATAVAANSYIQFAPTSAIDPTTFTQLVLHIRSKAAWPNQKSLLIAWYNAGVRQGSAIALGTGTYGFDSTITGAYQQIVLPIGLFALAAGTICDSLRMTVTGGGAGIGFYLDDVEVQTNSGALPSGYPAVIGPLTLLGNPSPTAPAIPSAITLGAGFTVTGTTISVSGGGGTPGGANTQVQFNNAGAFAGDVDLTWDSTLNNLTIGAGGSVKVAQGTITSNVGSFPAINTTATWNNSSNVFNHWYAAITDTASFSASFLQQMLVGGATKWSIDKTGKITVGQADAALLTSGTIATARLGSGTASASTFLRGDNTWQTIAASATTLTGDVTGSGTGSVATTVAAINGVALGITTATAGNLLIGSGTQWVTHAMSGDATISSSGVITVTKINGNTVIFPIPVGSGGTGLTNVSLGDTLYGGNTNTIQKLSGNVTTAKQFLTQTGTGSVPNPPVWLVISAADIPTTGLNITQHFGAIATDTISAGTATLNLGAFDWHTVTLDHTATTTLALTGGTTGQQFTVVLLQDSTGGCLVNWFSGIIWFTSDGNPPPLSSGANKRTVCTFKQIATGSYLGFLAGTQDGTSGGTGTVSLANISSEFFYFSLAGGGNPIAVAADVADWYPIALFGGTLTQWMMSAKTAPVGASLIIDILKSSDHGSTWATIFSNTAHRPTIASGANNAAGTTFDVAAFSAGDWFRIDVIQVGSTTPGSGITFKMG